MPYEFICKPGDVLRRPCIIAPYQPRIDWQIWFAAMSTPERYPWTLHLIWKLLHNDPGALSLLATNPFPDAPPRWVRARLFRYEFAPPGGAFYLFPKAPRGTGTAFVTEAVRHNLLVIPGATFSRRDTHFRISYAATDETIRRGVEILNRLAG